MASKAIRGITVEIGGDTTKLGKALEKTEKQSRSLQVELREIEKQLKFDPTNTELLAQKQTVLSQNIKETSSKLDTLKEAEKQVIKQFEKGEVAEDQVRALQREIIQTENTLDSMKSELSSTTKTIKDLADGTDNAEKHTKEYKESVKDAKEELSDFKEKASEAFDTVKTGAGILGGAVVATGGYALKVSTEFDKAFNTLITKTGASTDEMDDLNESMEKVYANNFGESIEDVAESMATVKTNTKLTGDALQETTEYALLMRDTFGFEVNESTRSAKMLMDQFGISSKDAYNLIAQGAQNGLDKNGDLLDTVNEYSVHFKQLGIDAPTMFNMLVNGADSGTFSVDKLGDAVKEFGIRAKDGSKATAEGFDAIGLDADTMAQKFGKGGESAKKALSETVTALFALDDPIKQNQAGVALFGTMWEDLGVDGVKALMNLDGQVSTSKDALKTINEQKYDDIGSAIQGLGRTLETDVVKPLGDELKPVVEEAIDTVKAHAPEIKDFLATIVTKIGEFITWVVDNGPTIISILAGIGTGLAVFKVASIINSVVGAIKAFKLANEGATVAQWAMNVAMNANPIGILVALIAGLVVAFIALWKNCEGFRNFWIGLWEKIKTAFSAFLTWISPAIESLKSFFVSLWEKIQEIWAVIMQSLQPLFDSIVGAFKEGWELIKVIWNKVVPYFKLIWDYIKAVFVVVKEVLGLYFKNAWEYIKLVWSVAVSYFKLCWENIKLVFSVVKTYLGGMFRTAWESIKAVWNGVTGYFKAIWDTIKGIFSVVKNVLTGNWRGAWNGIKGIVGTWANYFRGVWNSIKNVFGSVKTWFSSTFSSAWTAVKGVFSNWGSFFSGLWGKIKNTFSKIGTNISSAISGSLKSGINGVISSIQNIINSGIGLINGAINLINKIPGVSIGKLGKLSLPRLARGGIVDRPTVAQIGEDGREAIIPLEKNTDWLDKVAQRLNGYSNNPTPYNDGLLAKLDRIYERLNRLQVVLNNKALVGELIDDIDAGLADKQSLTNRGV